ncbi:thiamine diphosphokinase [Paenibacillus solisilvae]|uniref:Thiamine diphosphokinase n=1 Tax=Paenibacillus solisilvae TaxID=2486751 RepID=A0ABW0VTY8_9BACL
MDISRIVIFSGGRLGDWALRLIQPDDFLIGADRGALFLVSNGYQPDLALGDFDSVTEEELAAIRAASKETLDFDPVEKDFTDTELAWKIAMDKKPGQLLLIGGLGTRFDHTLANVHLLRQTAEHNTDAWIMDEHNRIRLVAGRACLPGSDFTYVSLLPLTATVTGITLEGFQYPLTDATLEIGQSLGISNKLQADAGYVSIREGLLLLIESRD